MAYQIQTSCAFVLSTQNSLYLVVICQLPFITWSKPHLIYIYYLYKW